MRGKLDFSWMLIAVMCVSIHAEPNYPADVSYLVADFKYSQEHGLKICEVQHGSLSAMQGDLYVFGEDGRISPGMADFLARFPQNKWAVGVIYTPLKRSLAARGWNVEHSLSTLVKDSVFLERAAMAPVDASCVTSYAGMVFADFDVARNLNFYRTRYPGILFINAATFGFWRDKVAMNALFNRSDELKPYKADWKVYPKKYDSLLAERILKDMPAERYVVKPRGEALANGVIVVAKSDLDAVLKMILEPSPSLGKHPDKKYAYWLQNRDDIFIIEKHYQSDSLISETGHHYDATMRIAFALLYDGGEMTYHSLGGFWKLPSKALEEEGTLNEKTISSCKAPFYKAVDTDLLKEADAHMEKAMLLLYRVMLNEQQ